MSTSSMEPTIPRGQKVLIDSDINRYTPQRFDMVLLQVKQEGYPDQLAIKRIVGLPAEAISIMGGVLRIDGKVVQESFEHVSDITFLQNEFIIPDGNFFVLGDNRPTSRDSRHFGAIPSKAIIGRIIQVGNSSKDAGVSVVSDLNEDERESRAGAD